VRIIAASNVDLERAVDEGRFRRESFLPAFGFPNYASRAAPAPRRHSSPGNSLSRALQTTDRPVCLRISKAALRALISYDWPGNVRELENAVERAVIIASGRQIELDDLPSAIGNIVSERQAMVRVERAQAASEGRNTKLEIDVPSSMDEIERHAIEATLDYTSGDKTRAARLLNIGRKTIYRKLEHYNGQQKPSESSDN